MTDDVDQPLIHLARHVELRIGDGAVGDNAGDGVPGVVIVEGISDLLGHLRGTHAGVDRHQHGGLDDDGAWIGCDALLRDIVHTGQHQCGSVIPQCVLIVRIDGDLDGDADEVTCRDLLLDRVGQRLGNLQAGVEIERAVVDVRHAHVRGGGKSLPVELKRHAVSAGIRDGDGLAVRDPYRQRHVRIEDGRYADIAAVDRARRIAHEAHGRVGALDHFLGTLEIHSVARHPGLHARQGYGLVVPVGIQIGDRVDGQANGPGDRKGRVTVGDGNGDIVAARVAVASELEGDLDAGVVDDRECLVIEIVDQCAGRIGRHERVSHVEFEMVDYLRVGIVLYFKRIAVEEFAARDGRQIHAGVFVDADVHAGGGRKVELDAQVILAREVRQIELRLEPRAVAVARVAVEEPDRVVVDGRGAGGVQVRGQKRPVSAVGGDEHAGRIRQRGVIAAVGLDEVVEVEDRLVVGAVVGQAESVRRERSIAPTRHVVGAVDLVLVKWLDLCVISRIGENAAIEAEIVAIVAGNGIVGLRAAAIGRNVDVVPVVDRPLGHNVPEVVVQRGKSDALGATYAQPDARLAVDEDGSGSHHRHRRDGIRVTDVKRVQTIVVSGREHGMGIGVRPSIGQLVVIGLGTRRTNAHTRKRDHGDHGIDAGQNRVEIDDRHRS